MQGHSSQNKNTNGDDSRQARLEKLKSIYMEQSAKASEVARTLAFGAAALCWLFTTNNIAFSSLIIKSLFFLVGYFIFDWLQFYTTSIEYYSFYCKERDNSLSEQERNKIIDKLGKGSIKIFHIKFVLLVIAYIFIVIELIKKMQLTGL
ncbi:MAG: hypothetical protein ACXVBF_08855 [Flavisolibacter sp.]